MQKKVTRLMKKYPYYKYSDINASPIRKVYRHLGGQLAIKLKNTKVTPNQITLLSFLFSLVASILILKRGYLFSALAGLILFISVILDKTDGSLARIRKEGSTFGTWLDSATDNLSMIILLISITFHSFSKTGNALYLIAGVLTVVGFQTGKVLFMIFKRTFKEADKVIDSEKKHKLRSVFHFNEYFIWNWSVVFMLFYKIEWLLAFMALYSWFFYLAMFSIFTKKAYKLNKTLSREEELKSK